jgi:hypothetical protein
MEISGAAVQQQVQLTVLRKTLDMVANQAKMVMDQGALAGQGIALQSGSGQIDIKV